MTREQWQEEFRKELDTLREPIERLCALITLYPYKSSGSRNNAIRNTFAAMANDKKNDPYSHVDIAQLEGLYQVLALLPKPHAHIEWLKRQYEVSEVQQFALMDLIGCCANWGDYYDLSQMEDDEKDDALQHISILCAHWKELLDTLQNDDDCSTQLQLLPTQPLTPVNEKLRMAGAWYTCKPVWTLLNNHPWNQKAKELLAQIDGDYGQYNTHQDKSQLYVISLMEFGLDNTNPKMRKHIEKINWECGYYEIEWKVSEMRSSWSPIQIMHYITAETDCNDFNDLPALLEANDPFEGATVLYYHLLHQMQRRAEI